MAHRIDETDVQILNLLAENSRISYADIAKAVGMKSPSVIERIKWLETEGILTGYTAQINYKKLGYDILAFIGIFIDNADNIADFEHHLKKLGKEIIGCHHVTGEYTMLIKVIVKNTEALSTLIKKLRNTPGVTKTNTILVFSTILDRSRLL
ncbi:MAG: Lrp/AsnC family transcriptional regulator [Deferribacterales bacterium]